MSRAHTMTAPSRQQARAAHPGRRTGRRAARGSAPVTPLPGRVLSVATLASAAVVLLLLVWVALGLVLHSRGASAAGSRQAALRAAGANNLLLVVQPRTVTQVTRVGRLQLALAANPVLPGPNRFVVSLVERGRAVMGAHVRVVATMPGMIMRPLSFQAGERRGGRYTATGSLSMFGRWQLTVQVRQGHGAPVTHVFALSLDFPPALLKAIGAHSHASP